MTTGIHTGPTTQLQYQDGSSKWGKQAVKQINKVYFHDFQPERVKDSNSHGTFFFNIRNVSKKSQCKMQPWEV